MNAHKRDNSDLYNHQQYQSASLTYGPARLKTRAIFLATAFIAVLLLLQILSSNFAVFDLREKIQFLSLALLPFGFLLILLYMVKQHKILAKSLQTQLKNFSPYMSDNYGNYRLDESGDALMKNAEQATQKITVALEMIDERIALMQTVSQAVESEFSNINEHLNKTLRDNLSQITATTHESMGELKDIIDIIKTREEAISRLNTHFHNMQNTASDMLESKQHDINNSMNQQMEKILENFNTLKNDISQHHDDLCTAVKNENSENHQKMSVLLDAHDEKIEELSHNIHKRHEGLLEVF